MEIRIAQPEEYAAVGALSVLAYAHHGQLPPEHDYEATLRDVPARVAMGEVLVAVEDDAILGTVTAVLASGPFAEIALPGEGGFRMLAVAPDAGGRGVGTALVGEVISRARQLGLTRLVCSTRPTMLHAHRIYERLGFSRMPGRDWEPVPGVPLIVYGLPLADVD